MTVGPAPGVANTVSWSGDNSIGWYYPNAAITPGSTVILYLRVYFREPCLLPLTIFDDSREFLQEGLHNVQELQLTYQVNSGINRVLRNCANNGVVLQIPMPQNRCFGNRVFIH
jgi:hypothetical protein